MKSLAKQKGVALVTAILMVAIATALATKLAWDNQVSMRRTEMTLAQEQGRYFAQGAEAVAIAVLLDDTDTHFDYITEEWAIEALPIGIEENVIGTMEGRIYDAQGKLNLNNLVQAGTGSIDGPSKDQLERLLLNLRLNTSIVDAIADWIDADTVPQGTGAEDGSYTSLDPPYRPANNYLLDITELRLISGMDEEIYQALLPHVTVIPPGWCGSAAAPVPVNINSATAEVIAALDPDITTTQAQGWVDDRDTSGIGWEDWTDIPGLPLTFEAIQDQYASLNTSCFDLRVLVNVGSSVLSMYSLLDRSALSGQFITRVRTYGVEY